MKTNEPLASLVFFIFLIPSAFLSWSPGYAQTGECETVSDSDRVEKIDITSYHAAGLPSLVAGLVQPKSFCRSYPVDKLTVSKIIAQVLPNIGNPPKLIDIQNGIFTTESTPRAHMTPWEDSYYITVSEETGGRSLVRVHRTLFVYSARRDPRATRPARPIPSDGHNEKWLLTQIGDRLATLGGERRGPSQPNQGSSGSGDARTTSAEDAEKKLHDLQQLRDKKLISEEEYQLHRKKVLENLLKK